jgi:hypothetical protein
MERGTWGRRDSPAGTMARGYSPEGLEPLWMWAGKGDRSGDRGRSRGDNAWGPSVRMRKGGGMRAPIQGDGLNGRSFFYFFSLFFISLLLVYIGIVDIYIYVYVCPF